jgi:hypothetical protein
VIGIFLAAVGVLVMAFLNDYLLMKPIWILAALIAGRSLRAGAKPAETS